MKKNSECWYIFHVLPPPWSLIQQMIIIREWHGLPMGKPWVFSYSLVALVMLNFLQFFSCKSVKNWPSYILCKFEPHSFTDEPTAPHLVSDAAAQLHLASAQLRPWAAISSFTAELSYCDCGLLRAASARFYGKQDWSAINSRLPIDGRILLSHLIDL